MNIENLIEDVQNEHEMRLSGCETVPLERRPRRIARQPKTAIIALAAQEAIAAREWANKPLFDHWPGYGR